MIAASILSADFFFCGGSLIAPDVVLTAAHCVNGGRFETAVRVFAGCNAVRGPRDCDEERAVVQMVLHPDWNDTTLANDVALLRLDSPLPLSGRINTVCLPSSAEDQPGEGEVVDTAGWGLNDTRANGGRVSDFLNEVFL